MDTGQTFIERHTTRDNTLATLSAPSGDDAHHGGYFLSWRGQTDSGSWQEQSIRFSLHRGLGVLPNWRGVPAGGEEMAAGAG